MNNACSPLILKLAVSSAALSPQLAALLALQRAEEPKTRVVMSEVPSIDLFRGLDKGHYDIGITCETSTAFTLSIRRLWRVELAVALPVLDRNPRRVVGVGHDEQVPTPIDLLGEPPQDRRPVERDG